MPKGMADVAIGNSFLKGTLILTVAGMVVKVIGSLNWIILSRVLGGEGIGLYQMAFPIYLLALSLSSAGIPVAVSIVTAEKVALRDYRGADRVFKISLLLMAVSGILLSLLVYFGAGWLIQYQIIRDSRAYFAILALAPAVFLVTMLSSFRGYLQGWQMMTPTAVSQMAEQLFRVGAMLGFAAWMLPYGLDYAAGGASLGAGIGAAAGLLVLLYYYRKLQRSLPVYNENQAEIPHPGHAQLLRRMIHLALPVSLSSLMLPLVSNFDLFIVPVRLEAAGFTVKEATELFGYLTGMAVPLMNLATIFTAAMATSLVPLIAELAAVGDRQQTGQRTAAAFRLANLVTLPAAVGLWVLATPIAAFVYHAPEAGAVIRVVAWGVYFLGIHQVTTGILQGMGYTLLPVVNMGIAAIIKVFLNWQLTAIPALGILGSGWATNADIGVAMLLNVRHIARYTTFQIDRLMLGKNIFAALVMGFSIDIIYFFLIEHGVNELLAVLLVILLAAVIYGLTLILVKGITIYDINRIPLWGGKLGSLLMRWKFIKR